MTRKRKDRSGGPLAVAKSDRAKRETNTQAVEARKQKRLKKRKGLTSGSRTVEGDKSKKRGSGTRKSTDPRVGSKAPITLLATPTVVEQAKVAVPKPANVVSKPAAPVLSFEQELERLENDARLSMLLIRLDNNEVINTEEQDYVDQCIERHEFLLAELGYADDDEFDEEFDEDEWDEEMMARLDAQALPQNTEKLSEEELYERFLNTEKKFKNNSTED